jgi:DNA-directed RNA polymerase subunit RPC12/RpoP
MAQEPSKRPTYEACPHCGTTLSPWEKVLLSVDRALMCRNCWYRIILDVQKEEQTPKKDKQ